MSFDELLIQLLDTELASITEHEIIVGEEELASIAENVFRGASLVMGAEELELLIAREKDLQIQVEYLLQEIAHLRLRLEDDKIDLTLPQTREFILLYSPSVYLLKQLRSSQISLHDLQSRQLEELVAELLTQDGYQVQLGRGTKDDGVDIIAMKKDPTIGFFLTVWQAKKLNVGNKVDLHVIRELADTRMQHNATKGIIVTTTSLTKGALARIEQDRYLLGKVDGNDLTAWIRKGE